MRFLLDSGKRLLHERYDFIGGQLMTPGGKQAYLGGEYGIDNGALGGFNRAAFDRLLQRQLEARKACLFLACPDVVGNARRTLEAFEWWSRRLSAWPVALVAQDGLEALPIPWHRFDTIFIGGSTDWKMGEGCADIIRTAKILGKSVHVGRVNTPARFKYFEELGCDWCDGSGAARYEWMLEAIAARNFEDHPLLAAARAAEEENDAC